MSREFKHRFRGLFPFLVLVLYNVLLTSLYITLRNMEHHKISVWLFDDRYTLSNNLQYYIDFRPGYPPIGKLPYTLLYMISNGDDIPIFVYNLLTLNISAIAVFYLMRILDSRKAFISLLLYIFSPLIITTAINVPHGDFLALTFTIASLISICKKSSILTAVFIALGFLTKVYPGFLLIPAIMIFGRRDLMKLLLTFTSTVWLVSLPFVIRDPLMYITTYIQHMFRGPSESLISIIEGYFGHTGFLHPLFDATIYYWQFTNLYNPSAHYHFNYEWRYPFLKHLSILTWISGIMLSSLAASRTTDTVSRARAVAMAVMIPIAFSPTYNCLMSIPLYTLAFVLLAKSPTITFITFISFLAMAMGVHAIIWSPIRKMFITFIYFLANTLGFQVILGSISHYLIEFALYIIVSYQALTLAALFTYVFRTSLGER